MKFLGEAISLPLGWSPVKGSTLVGSSLACKYKTWVEVNRGGKHSSLLQYRNNYSSKKFYSTGPQEGENSIKKFYISGL